MYDPTTRFLRIFVCLLIPVILIIGVVRAFTTDAYLSFEYRKANFPADPLGFDPAMRFTHAAANIKYVKDDRPASFLAEQKHEQVPLYNDRELKHMQDVQSVYLAVGRIWHSAILFLLLAFLIFWMRTESLPALFPAIKTGGLLTAGLVAVVGLLAVAAWQSWFVVFHQVFFAPGSWTFNPTDTLIRLFPERFWFDTAVNISLMSLAVGLFLYLLCSLVERSLIPTAGTIS